MCAEGKVNYTQKYLCGCSAIMMKIIIILSFVISLGGIAGNLVEMVVIGFKFVLVVTQILHYCNYTKKVVKHKVKRMRT